MALLEDTTPFFGDFADDATLAGAPVRVIFDGAYAQALDIGASSPRVTLPTASVPPAWEDVALHILTGQGAGHYKVRNHEPDGTGVSVLVLEKTA